MKTYFKYIFLALAAAIMLPSCADEGPEALAEITAKATEISITPYSAKFNIDIALGNIESNEIKVRAVADNYTSDTWESWMDVDGSSIGDTYTFSNLRPNTSYTIVIQVGFSGAPDEYGYSYSENYLTITPDGGKFTTKNEGDFSDIGNCTMSTELLTEESALLKITLPANIRPTQDNIFGIRYSTSPDFTDATTIPYGASTESGEVVGDLYNDNFVISAAIGNLAKATTYYVQVVGHFIYRVSYDNEILMTGIDSLPCYPESFTTLAQPNTQRVGIFSAKENRIGAASAQLDIYFDNNLRIAGTIFQRYAVLSYSTTADFATTDTLHISVPSYDVSSVTVDFRNLNPYTKYYYYISGVFISQDSETGNDIYMTGRAYPSDGSESFTTASYDHDVIATVYNITASSALVKINMTDSFRFSTNRDNSKATLLCSTLATDFSKAQRVELIHYMNDTYAFSYENAYFWVDGLTPNTTYYLRVTGDIEYNWVLQKDCVLVPENGTFKTTSSANTVDGHEYVDLGLPSGTKWATVNVGAENMTEYGDYYNWSDAKIAAKSFGNSWTLPDYNQFYELYNCDSESVAINGIRGKLYISSNGNCLFLPYNGYYSINNPTTVSPGSDNYYWSSTPYGSNTAYYFGDGIRGMNASNRLGVRPVVK